MHSVVDAQVELNIHFPAHTGRGGLGLTKLIRNPNPAQRRKLASGVLEMIADEKRTAHAHSLSRQGVWTQWSDKAIPFDFSWKNIIYGPGEHLLKFVLHASVNWVRTPDLLRLWGYICTNQAKCKLCEAPNCTLHHILSNCDVALQQKRYTWRHDSVNLHLFKELSDLTSSHNGKMAQAPSSDISFVRAGESRKSCTRRTRRSLLQGTGDWQIGVDFDHKQFLFPPEICSTDSRPDIVIWSKHLRKVILIELTCPAEEGIENASSRKQLRYADLKVLIRQNGWLPTLFTIEVGVRGFVAKSLRKCLLSLGMKNTEINRLCKSVSLISAKCSYAIYSARESQFWDSNKPPLEIITDTTDDNKSDKRASIPPIDNNTKIQIAKRRRIAESKLALTMKAKIAQKRKIAETKLAKTMKFEIEKRREKAKERAQRSKYKIVQRPEKKHKSLLLEETSDHKAKARISKFEEKHSQYPDSLPSISSSGYTAVATSNIPVVKRVTWHDNSGGQLTDVSIYPVSQWNS